MKKLLLAVSTVSLLFAASVQSTHAEGITDWFKGMFSSEESIESDAETHVGVGHEAMEVPDDDNEENYTPYAEDNSSSDETEDQTDSEDDVDAKESAPIEDTIPHRI